MRGCNVHSHKQFLIDKTYILDFHTTVYIVGKSGEESL